MRVLLLIIKNSYNLTLPYFVTSYTISIQIGLWRIKFESWKSNICWCEIGFLLLISKSFVCTAHNSCWFDVCLMNLRIQLHVTHFIYNITRFSIQSYLFRLQFNWNSCVVFCYVGFLVTAMPSFTTGNPFG